MLSNYYKLLYRIFKFVDEYDTSVLDNDEKYKYTSIVRSQLSEYEVVLLFFNGLSYGRDKFKPLIEKYAILKNMPHGDLHKYWENKKNEYENNAFERDIKI